MKDAIILGPHSLPLILGSSHMCVLTSGKPRGTKAQAKRQPGSARPSSSDTTKPALQHICAASYKDMQFLLPISSNNQLQGADRSFGNELLPGVYGGKLWAAHVVMLVVLVRKGLTQSVPQSPCVIYTYTCTCTYTYTYMYVYVCIYICTCTWLGAMVRERPLRRRSFGSIVFLVAFTGPTRLKG